MKQATRIAAMVVGFLLTAALVWGGANLAFFNFAPSEQMTRDVGTGGQSAFKNISTGSMQAFSFTVYTGAGRYPYPCKIRIGGFSTGNETDYYIASTGQVTVPATITKYGFKPLSSAKKKTAVFQYH